MGSKKARKKAKIARETKDYKTSALAYQEMASRELARRHLLPFIKRMNPNYVAGWMHVDICRRLEKFIQDIIEYKDPRIMIFCPPRHGKSEIASKNLPAWVLGQHPHFEIINTSYTINLPTGFSRDVRSMLRDPFYQNLFPGTRLDKDNQNAEGWKTTEGGMYLPSGVSGAITGKGANIFSVDDPIKDAEQADSAKVRQAVWDWYGSTAYTRLEPQSGVLVIQTRWHDDDLSGRLLRQMNDSRKEISDIEKDMRKDANRLSVEKRAAAQKRISEEIDTMRQRLDDWEVVNYPAIAENDEYLYQDGSVQDHPGEGAELLRMKGEALHPERISFSRLMRSKRVLQPRHWSALYQQNPIPDEGLYFKEEYLRYEPEKFAWEGFPVFIAFDFAIGKKETNDYTVGVVGALDYDDRIHIIDIVRGRWDAFEIVETILTVYKAYSYNGNVPRIGFERGQIEKSIGPQLTKRMGERRIYLSRDDTLVPTTDKMQRAAPLQGRMQQGMVLFPSNQPWVETAVAELLRFPGGVHDDIVDAMAWLAILTLSGSAPRRPKRPKYKSWKDKLNIAMINKGKEPKNPMAS